MGVGGVGSNLLRTICNQADRFLVRIYDHDTVELHNLNRSLMFSIADAAMEARKVVAVDSAVRSLSSGTKHPIEAFLPVAVDKQSSLPSGLIIDARDTMDPSKVLDKTWLKLAYDGGSDVSFTWLPNVVADKIFDLTANGRSTYEVVPSFYGPAALLGILALRFMEFPNFLEITPLRAGTFTCSLDEVAESVSWLWEPNDDDD